MRASTSGADGPEPLAEVEGPEPVTEAGGPEATTTAGPPGAAWYSWAVPASMMAVVGGLGIQSPSLWGDELATWGMATISWGRAADVLHHVDAVMAPYYLLMNGWVRLFGDSDVSLRLPSLLAMVATAALIGLIGARTEGARVGLVAGALFAVLPISSAFAQEARAYAFADLAVALASYLLLGLLERPSRRRLVGYAAGVALIGLSHLVALLILLPHAVLVLLRRRDLLGRWAGAAAVGAVPSLPLLWSGWQQRRQISWVATFVVTWRDYANWIGGSVVGFVVVLALCVAGSWRRWPGWWFAAWALLPPLALLAASPVLSMMLPRYLLFVLPGWMLLAATGLSRFAGSGRFGRFGRFGRPRVVAGAGAAVVLVIGYLGFSWQWDLRVADGHNRMDARALARMISDRYQPGDAIVYAQGGDDPLCCYWAPRDAMIHYLPADRRPADVLLRVPQRTAGQVAGVECSDVAACLGSPSRLWIVRLGNRWDPLPGLGFDRESLVRGRFRQVDLAHPPGYTVALMVPA